MIWLIHIGLAAADAVIGGSENSAALVQVGLPWNLARVHYPLSKPFNLVGEYQVANYTRHQAFFGINQMYIDKKWRLTGDLFGGYLYQNGQLDQRGIAGELRLRTGKTKGRARPWFSLGSHHLLLRNETILQTKSGEDKTIDTEHVWSLTGAMGLVIPIPKNLSLVTGIDFPWIPVPNPSIPGIHLALCWSAS
ncbi:MAG: hypothetical protein VXZ96_01655 [Myxococcota bacterium]|nr:hypothetical protein [Myxococcota bacterium]MEC8378995.1 hypothetical protein [Myxococcota bacterium]